MKKVLVSILAVVMNIITMPFQALTLIGLKKRLEKADANMYKELIIIHTMCDGRAFNYDQFSDLKQILAKHYENIFEGPTKIWVKWTKWTGNYIPLVKEFLDEEYYETINSYISAELMNTVAISC